jgi:segregation and condensation protein B
MGDNQRQLAGPPAADSPRENAQNESSPLSLNRLREAFAQMLGTGPDGDSIPPAEAGSPKKNSAPRRNDVLMNVACQINPRSVVEAILFVGRPDNGSTSARELAAAMRGVSPAEIDAAVAELNALYDDDATPYRIEGTSAGYRLVLRHDFQRMRDKFYGRVREAKLSPAALEVLSIVAYNQPMTAEQINELRGAASGAVLATLVRRQLIRLERAANPGESPRYWTSERFLRLLGLENLAALPRSEELEKA